MQWRTPVKGASDAVIVAIIMEEFLTDEKYDYLLVGSGLYAAVFAWMAGKHGKRCLVIERESILEAIFTVKKRKDRVHQYGAYIFPYLQPGSMGFVNQFTEFNRYTNSPVINYNGGCTICRST